MREGAYFRKTKKKMNFAQNKPLLAVEQNNILAFLTKILKDEKCQTHYDEVEKCVWIFCLEKTDDEIDFIFQHVKEQVLLSFSSMEVRREYHRISLQIITTECAQIKTFVVTHPLFPSQCRISSQLNTKDSRYACFAVKNERVPLLKDVTCYVHTTLKKAFPHLHFFRLQANTAQKSWLFNVSTVEPPGPSIRKRSRCDIEELFNKQQKTVEIS